MATSRPTSADDISYLPYSPDEVQLPAMIKLIDKELSEPYVVYTYRYFLFGWPELCYLAFKADHVDPVGVIICKMDKHRGKLLRGYIAMLVVEKEERGKGIAKKLFNLALEQMKKGGVDEVVLETEIDNAGALSFYSSLGFIREKRLYRFYLNAKDAYRLVLPLPRPYLESTPPPLPSRFDRLHVSS